MKIDIDGLKINYEVKGNGLPLVLIHGWGCSLKTVVSIQNFMAQWYSVYSIDLPGFGESDDPPMAWGVEEYSKLVEKFMDKLNIVLPVIMGHSVGGRIAIWLGAKTDVEKLVLIDSAGIKKKLSMKSHIKVKLFKMAKMIIKHTPGLSKNADKIIQDLKNKIGSPDYKNAKPILKDSLVKIVNEDLQYLMPKIKAPTLLVWGENDTETPIHDAEIMNGLISDAGIALIKNSGHYSFLDNPVQFQAVIKSFLV